jgi:hypothetical protein
MAFEYIRRRGFIVNRAYRRIRNRLVGKPPGDMVERSELILLHFVLMRRIRNGSAGVTNAGSIYMRRRDIPSINAMDLVVTEFRECPLPPTGGQSEADRRGGEM